MVRRDTRPFEPQREERDGGETQRLVDDLGDNLGYSWGGSMGGICGGALGVEMGGDRPTISSVPFGWGHSRHDTQKTQMVPPFVQTPVWKIVSIVVRLGKGF